LKGENNGINSMRKLLKQISIQTANGMNGIIVSSDPHLRSMGVNFDTLLRAGFTGWACYPYKEYKLTLVAFVCLVTCSPTCPRL
jgi:hypothetical protein